MLILYVDDYFIRTASDVIAPYLTQLCHYCFEFGIYPDCLKIAKIIPIYKNGSTAEVNNYQPISLFFQNCRKTTRYSSNLIF